MTTSELKQIKIIQTLITINERMFDKQYLKDWKYIKETQKPFINKQHTLCEKLIKLWWSLYINY